MKIFIIVYTTYISPIVPSRDGNVFKVVVTVHTENWSILIIIVGYERCVCTENTIIWFCSIFGNERKVTFVDEEIRVFDCGIFECLL